MAHLSHYNRIRVEPCRSTEAVQRIKSRSSLFFCEARREPIARVTLALVGLLCMMAPLAHIGSVLALPYDKININFDTIISSGVVCAFLIAGISFLVRALLNGAATFGGSAEDLFIHHNSSLHIIPWECFHSIVHGASQYGITTPVSTHLKWAHDLTLRFSREERNRFPRQFRKECEISICTETITEDAIQYINEKIAAADSAPAPLVEGALIVWEEYNKRRYLVPLIICSVLVAVEVLSFWVPIPGLNLEARGPTLAICGLALLLILFKVCRPAVPLLEINVEGIQFRKGAESWNPFALRWTDIADVQLEQVRPDEEDLQFITFTVHNISHIRNYLRNNHPGTTESRFVEQNKIALLYERTSLPPEEALRIMKANVSSV